jgi:hypothetical protein
MTYDRFAVVGRFVMFGVQFAFMLVMKKIDPVNQSIVWVDVGVVIRFTSSCVSAKENIPDTDKVDTVPSKYGPVLPVAPVFAANPGIPWIP